jgi:hypothetical protein
MVETVDDIEWLNSVYLLVYLVQETSSKWLWLRNSGAIFTGQAKIGNFYSLWPLHYLTTTEQSI